MSLLDVFDITGSAMGAQNVRLNTVASNLANVDTASPTAEGAYKARQPVFAAVMNALQRDGEGVPVRVAAVVESQVPARMEYLPGHPLANEEGYVFFSNVNPVEEMANMMSASRSYQNNAEVFNTAKQLLLKTLALGQ